MVHRMFIVRLAIAISLVAGVSGCGTGIPGVDPNVEVIEHTDYNPPLPVQEELVDDRIEDKHTAIVAELVDRRPLEGWLVNQSEAVIRLDIPLVKPLGGPG